MLAVFWSASNEQVATVVHKGNQLAGTSETTLAARETQQDSLHQNILRSLGVR